MLKKTINLSLFLGLFIIFIIPVSTWAKNDPFDYGSPAYTMDGYLSSSDLRSPVLDTLRLNNDWYSSSIDTSDSTSTLYKKCLGLICTIRDNTQRLGLNEIKDLTIMAYLNVKELRKKHSAQQIIPTQQMTEIRKDLGNQSISLANRCLQTGLLSEALEWFDKALDIAEDLEFQNGKVQIGMVQYYQASARHYHEQGDMDKLKEQHEKVLENKPIDGEGNFYHDMAGPVPEEKAFLMYYSNYLLGESYYHLTNYEEALKKFKKAEALLVYYQPWGETRESMYLYQGLCHDKLGQDPEALGAIKKAVDFERSSLDNKYSVEKCSRLVKKKCDYFSTFYVQQDKNRLGLYLDNIR